MQLWQAQLAARRAKVAEWTPPANLAAWWYADADVAAGANWVDQEVVEDKKLITSRTPDDLPLFNAAMLQLLAEHHPPL